jgi:hypothetical protein
MSLDVYLRIEGAKIQPTGSGIFVRKAGTTMQITRAEWDAMHPGQEPAMYIDREPSDIVYHANITHNLGEMARAAGVYQQLWRPEEIGIFSAWQLIKPLGEALFNLLAAPDTYKAYNPENGWGNYDGLLAFVGNYLIACINHPGAAVSASR